MENEFSFWDNVRAFYVRKFYLEYPDTQQSSPLYEIFCLLQGKLRVGVCFLKPDSNEYYALSDYDVHSREVNERELFITDLNNCKSIIEFIGMNHRDYPIVNPEHSQYIRYKAF